ncbi:glycosyltransferase, partial [Thermoplasmatales archaeon SCGC AB-539-N05]
GKYISKKNKSPLILIKHDIVWKKLKSDGSKFYIPARTYEKFIFKKADAVTTISMEDYRYAVKYTDEKNVHYIPPGLDLDVFKPKGNSYNFGEDKLNLLFYGSLDRPMNIGALKFIKEKLIPLLQKKNLLEKVGMNIFGSGIPPKYLQIEQDKNINFLGVVEDPGKYIRGADLVIVPVRNLGGTKIRVLEVLFCGKPAIVTPEVASGLPDELKDFVYIEEEEDGFLKVIIKFLENHSTDKTNSSVIKKYIAKSRTMNDVVNYVIDKKSLDKKKEGQ